MTTSEPREAYVWIWLPGATDPVVAGLLEAHSNGIVTFTYGRSYLNRSDAIALYLPELPLRPGRIDPLPGLSLPSAIRDAGPDSWGQRVILARRTGHLTRHSDTGDLGPLTYLLESGSNRIGALDFQSRPDVYVHRGGEATLDQLVSAAQALDAGEALPEELGEALVRGTSIGGARPKALISDGKRHLVAKFSSASDTYPVVKAEALGMLLARAAGVRVPNVDVTRSLGRDVLLVERFDRTTMAGERRQMVSVLTILGLDEMMGRYATYTDVADVVRARYSDPAGTLAELFRRIAVNICIGNTDDHARNHAAFWDGHTLALTPAYDLCPQPRSGREANQAMAFGPNGQRAARLTLLLESAPTYLLSQRAARNILDEVVNGIRNSYRDCADQARLTTEEASRLMGRQILNPYAIE
mgnify:FL=1